MLDIGYKPNLFALAEIGGFAVPIFLSLIFTITMADTTYCGPSFFLFFRISRYILKYNDVVKFNPDYIKIVIADF